MIFIQTLGGRTFAVLRFREIPTASQGFCSAEWHTDPGWIPGWRWMEAVTTDGHTVTLAVDRIDYIEEEVVRE